MIIVKERQAMLRPQVCVDASVLKMVNNRRLKLSIFAGCFVLMLVLGVVLCIIAAVNTGETLAVACIYFGFVGGTFTYFGAVRLGPSIACWVHPDTSLLEIRSLWFGLCFRHRWVDMTEAKLIELPARIRCVRTTRNPFIWLVVPFLIVLGPLGFLIDMDMERVLLLKASALCLRSANGRVEMVVVAQGENTVSEFIDLVYC